MLCSLDFSASAYHISTQNGDHYGLEKIKRRLIEYLAVVKLKTMQAAKETELQSSQFTSVSCASH